MEGLAGLFVKTVMDLNYFLGCDTVLPGRCLTILRDTSGPNFRAEEYANAATRSRLPGYLYTLKMEALRSSEMEVKYYQTIRRPILKKSYIHGLENFKSNTINLQVQKGQIIKE
jgi:hypothetical protein